MSSSPEQLDRFYFRQLLSGRDFAQNDQIAQQMVNFTYAIGDRAKGVALDDLHVHAHTQVPVQRSG